MDLAEAVEAIQRLPAIYQERRNAFAQGDRDLADRLTDEGRELWAALREFFDSPFPDPE